MLPASPLRLFRSELRMLFRRRRNQVLLGVLGVVPILIAVAVRTSQHGGRDGSIFGGITGNGLFAALAALLVAGPVFLPLLVSIVAGDTVAGEASSGTLRYLLAAPVGRTRLLGVKFAAALVWCLACVLEVAVIGLIMGFLLFPTGRVTLLSGTSVPFAEGLGRLVLVSGYVAACALTVAAIGLFVSTMTEVPIAAMAATLTLVVASEVADAVPQLAAIHHWLPSHYWTQWVDLLRDPIDVSDVRAGLWSTFGYVLFFASLAWARFGGKDITS